ncbi:hypothetical protein AgCh_023056 [Apium graveolens]
MRNYEKCWWAHGEKRNVGFTSNNSGSSSTYHMDEMVHDIAGQNFDWEQTREQPMNSDAKAFSKLLEEGREPLWHGCTKHTKLSAVATLLNIKADHNISRECFESLLKAIKSMLPDNEKLPDNYYYCKKMVKKLGLGYQKIDACLNDCMLFYKENEKITKCTICGHDRYKPNKEGVITKKSSIPFKILRYFPITDRLKRLYTSTRTAEHMSWHAKSPAKDGELNHPADGHAWKDFNKTHPQFVLEPRNVRLGLSTDGFNPFGHSVVPYSCWQMIVTPYNLPSWLCMKQPYMFLSHDSRAALMWTISDFPTYENHPFRRNRENFRKGKVENDRPVPRLSGTEMRARVMKLPVVPFDNNDKKISGFGKTKDNDKVWLDLKDICKRPALELQKSFNGKTVKPHARYTLTKKQIEDVCTWIKSVKLPDGYASNIARCVTDKTPHGKLKGMKSHDCHVFLERLLPIAFRDQLYKPIRDTLTELSHFFNDLCAKSLNEKDVSILEKNIIEITCKLEKIFPPGFFDSMEHLTIHLPYEARVGGPVQYSWMYPFERLMGMLKRAVKNRACVEGSICEAYSFNEIYIFVSDYFPDEVLTKANRVPRNDDGEILN